MNKPLSEKVVYKFASTEGCYCSSDVKQAVKESYEDIEKEHDYNAGLITLGDILRIFKDKFGFDMEGERQ